MNYDITTCEADKRYACLCGDGIGAMPATIREHSSVLIISARASRHYCSINNNNHEFPLFFVIIVLTGKNDKALYVHDLAIRIIILDKT